MNRLLATATILAATTVAMASAGDTVETVRPVSSAYMIEGGSAHNADSYLTPLRYRGWNGAVAYQRRQAMRFDPERWVMDLRGKIGLDRTENPARNATMWAADIEASWSMTRRFALPHDINIGIGGYTGIDAGALYLARNGNNPVAAKGAWEIGPAAYVSFRTAIKKIPVTLAYDVRMPLTGVFFTPDYGQLYYEIWLGERSGIVSGIWPGNYFRMDNRVTADLHFGATTLRLGYACDIHSSKARGIVTRRFSHAAIVGVVCEWLSLAPGKKFDSSTRIISATY